MTYTPQQYAVVLRQRSKAWKGTSAIAEKFRQSVETDAKRLLSGTITRQQEKQMGYPYGRESVGGGKRGPQRQSLQFVRGKKQPISRGYLPRLPINKQRGTVMRALRVRLTVKASEYEIRVSFQRTKALWVLVPGGTRRMVARGFLRELHRRQLIRKSRIIKDVKVVLRPN